MKHFIISVINVKFRRTVFPVPVPREKEKNHTIQILKNKKRLQVQYITLYHKIIINIVILNAKYKEESGNLKV